MGRKQKTGKTKEKLTGKKKKKKKEESASRLPSFTGFLLRLELRVHSDPVVFFLSRMTRSGFFFKFSLRISFFIFDFLNSFHRHFHSSPLNILHSFFMYALSGQRVVSFVLRLRLAVGPHLPDFTSFFLPS